MPTVSLQAGLAAMVVFDAELSAGENAEAMEEAAGDVVTGAVTIASRDVQTNGLAVSKGANAESIHQWILLPGKCRLSSRSTGNA